MTKRRIKDKVKVDSVLRTYQRQLAEEVALLELVKKKYRQEVKSNEKERTIQKQLLIHRLVAEYFCTRPSDEHKLVIHLNHYKLNNNWQNLKWATQDEVTEHQKHNPKVKAAKGNRKGKRVDDASNYKLTETRVMLIKKQIREGKRLRTLAKQFKVSETQLLRIKRGLNWGNVKAAN